jgi:signal transduction histidine kinase
VSPAAGEHPAPGPSAAVPSVVIPSPEDPGAVGRPGLGRTPEPSRARLRRLTVEGWFRLVFAVVALLVIVVTVVVLDSLSATRHASDELSGSILPAQAQAYRLQGALVDQETGVRGYGITGDRGFLQPYTAGRVTEQDAAVRLRALLGRRQPLAGDLRTVEAAAAAWRRDYATPLIARAGHGRLAGSDLSQLAASKAAFDHLRTLFARQNNHLAVAAAADSAGLGRAQTVQNVTYLAILAAFLIVAVLLALLLHNAVGRPVRRLYDASQLVADGDYSRHIEPTGPADLWAVAAVVERMRSGLVEALEASRAAEEVAARQATDLDAQAAELRRSNSELEQFAYVASHDLQEPLRKVASFCQLLEKRYRDQLDERGLEYIAFAVDGAKRMQVLINDLLTFSRVGRAGDVRIPVQLDEPLEVALTSLSTAVEESSAVISRPGRLPEVAGDPTLLAMMWQNLVGNAIKFRSQDRPPVIRITSARQPDGKWQCCVTDNGIGIPPEFAEKVFVIFQRLHGRNAYPGTGIGLALCKRIVEQHGGEMRLDTSYSGGTRICFTLPPAPAVEPSPEPAAEDAAEPAAGPTAGPAGQPATKEPGPAAGQQAGPSSSEGIHA